MAPDDLDCRTSIGSPTSVGTGDHRPSRVGNACAIPASATRANLRNARHSWRRHWDFPRSRGRRCRARRRAWSGVIRSQIAVMRKQRHPLQAQRGDGNQRQRGQKEQRDAPIGLHIDREDQAAERRPDRDHDLDDPDIERLGQRSRPHSAAVRPDGAPTSRRRAAHQRGPAKRKDPPAPPARRAAPDCGRHSPSTSLGAPGARLANP